MLEKIINLKLLTIPNIIAIWAILFFWFAIVFAMNNLGGDENQ